MYIMNVQEDPDKDHDIIPIHVGDWKDVNIIFGKKEKKRPVSQRIIGQKIRRYNEDVHVRSNNKPKLIKRKVEHIITLRIHIY